MELNIGGCLFLIFDIVTNGNEAEVVGRKTFLARKMGY